MMSKQSKVTSAKDESDMHQKKNKLIDQIETRAGKEHEQTPFNVAIIGPMGVGKSSLVNTIAAALSGEQWREYAYSGSHSDGSQITIFTKSFRKCCLEQHDRFSDVALPTLIDIAGFNDECNEKWVEILRIIFYGRLPEEESISEAEKHYNKYGLDGLIKKYNKNNERLKVDRIIFVSAATSPVPTNLIKAVLQAARPTDSEDNKMRRTIPIFGVMTKADQIGNDNLPQSEFDERQDKFISALGLKGSKTRYLLCQNYCDDTDPDKKRITSLLPELDLPVLEFMVQVCDRAIRVINPCETYKEPEEPNTQPAETPHPQPAETPHPQPAETPLTVLSGLGLTQRNVMIGLIIAEPIIMALILQFLFQPSQDLEKLRNTCRSVKEERNMSPFEKDLCDSIQNMSSSSHSLIIFLTVAILKIVLNFLFMKINQPTE